MKIGCIEEDIIALIKWKKWDKRTSSERTYGRFDKSKDPAPICNQLSMVDSYTFHEFWWKCKINPELYWELQYEWLDHPYFHRGVFMEGINRALKQLNFTRVLYLFAKYLLWEEIVKINYQLYVKLPYQIRNGINI